MRAFRIAYAGHPFHGFQRQPDVPTVEGALLDALRDLDVLDVDADTPPGYAAAGRTDAGASALAQTVAFECPDWLSPAALDGELPSSVRAWAQADAPADFHATHDAAAREYVYHWHAPDADLDPTRAALDCLSGTNDFHNLTPDDEGTVRDLDARVERDGEYLVFALRAGGFPRQLVRRIVALVEAVGSGEADLTTVERVLGPEPLDGPDGIAPAPAYPLVLTAVEYPELDFEVDPDAAASARQVFGGLRAERTTEARVAGTILDGVDSG